MSVRHCTTSVGGVAMTALSRRSFVCAAAVAAGALALPVASHAARASETGAPSLSLDMSAWNLDADNGVWWQVGVSYCTKPAAQNYETLGIYVPQAYMSGEQNADGTYSCTLSPDGEAGSYTCATAPVVIPVNTAGYSAQAAPTSYSYDAVSSYVEAGLVYVYPGCRGRANGYADDGTLAFAGGAPWGVTDLKAAVRFLRYNRGVVPGDVDVVFTFGHSGGGAQSALMGATGDAATFTPYLESIGAAMQDASGADISDSVTGSMCWCPITCLDTADEAYEWMMGQFADSSTRELGTWTSALSADLAASYPAYVNAAGFVDAGGSDLTLEESGEGTYLAGTYYDHLLALVNRSLNNFLADTTFPYTPSSQTMADGGFGGRLSGAPAEACPAAARRLTERLPVTMPLRTAAPLPAWTPLWAPRTQVGRPVERALPSR